MSTTDKLTIDNIKSGDKFYRPSGIDIIEYEYGTSYVHSVGDRIHFIIYCIGWTAQNYTDRELERLLSMSYRTFGECAQECIENAEKIVTDTKERYARYLTDERI